MGIGKKDKSKNLREYDDLYSPSPYSITYNDDDPDITFVEKNRIEVQLPPQPGYPQMVNYGMHPKNQYFVRPEMPPKLKELNKKRYKDIEDYWNEIKNNYQYYKEELWFIKQEWNRRENGVWYLINGQATFISKWHYFFLTSYTVGPTKGVFFDYRDRDRRWFIFMEHVDASPVDYGANYPKHRREGATSKVASIVLNLATSPNIEAIQKNALKCGIQSKDEPSASNFFASHCVPQNKNLPFYFMPRNSNPSNPKEKLYFGPPSDKKSKEDSGKEELTYLNTEITFKASGELLFDGEKLRMHVGDENGKTKEANVERRHSTVKLCCSLGNEIIGLIINPSTVGEMDKEGGANFKELAHQSQNSERDDNGQTVSGLVNLFIPAFDGLQGFIGPYGESIIDTPTPQQEEFMWKTNGKVCEALLKRHIKEFGSKQGFKLPGARKYLQNRRDFWLKKKKTDQLSKEKRQHPMAWRECWTTMVDETCPFDLYKIETRLEAFIGGNPWVRYGKFIWEGWDNSKYQPQDLPSKEMFINKQARVVWKETSQEEAEWEISYLYPDPKDSNKFTIDPIKGYVPGMRKYFCAGGDPIKSKDKTTTKKPSLAAGTVYRKFDSTVDDINCYDKNAINPETKDTFWVTDRFCAIYLKRPEIKAMYGEAMLKACLYYGCTMFPEGNLPYLYEYFEETRGFGEWLTYKVDKKRKFETTMMQHTSDLLKVEIYGEWADYIYENALREVHPTILMQARDVGPDGMTDYDLFAAGGYALLNLKQSRLYKTDQDTTYETLNVSELIGDFNAYN